MLYHIGDERPAVDAAAVPPAAHPAAAENDAIPAAGEGDARPEAEAAQQQQQANDGAEWREQGQGEAEEANWNPMDWDRPAEELTWERLLGLDGSLLFLEHVFWVMSLNTLFILVSAEIDKAYFFPIFMVEY